MSRKDTRLLGKLQFESRRTVMTSQLATRCCRTFAQPPDTLVKRGLLIAGRKAGTIHRCPVFVPRGSPWGTAFQPGHGMTNRSMMMQAMTMQSNWAIRRWRPAAIVTLAATAALTLLFV